MENKWTLARKLSSENSLLQERESVALEARFSMHCVLCGTAFLNLSFGLCFCRFLFSLSLIAVSADRFDFFLLLAVNNGVINSRLSEKAQPIMRNIIRQNGKMHVSFKAGEFQVLFENLPKISNKIRNYPTLTRSQVKKISSTLSCLMIAAPICLPFRFYADLDKSKYLNIYSVVHFLLLFFTILNGFDQNYNRWMKMSY